MVDFINKWKQGLERTRRATFGRLAVLLGVSEIDANTWDDLEALLLQADMGVETSQEIIVALRQRVHQQGLTRTSELQQALKEELLKRLDEPPPINLDSYQPAVILIVGVNGSGKTTTIAKLARWFKQHNKKVLLVAADTFRAAAIDQLQVWAERLELPIVAGQPNADPGAVAYDGIQAALARKVDIVLIDTAGRLHTRYNLMEELKKVYRVVGKALPGAPHAVWLVLDATTGQNALQQARAFKDAVSVNGIILAKLDSSARGGMAFAIQRTLGIPILFVGLGEKPEDLDRFDPEAFVQGILEG
ncbi:signal recognition particle-docking protein FtsY [uncultured Thermanaerothrix sp.]|uniref:signal recognition particle-docking protein FtsY n=1 Tax=uncultured Thermanaerothrix sp. TaxID=1195149 RepID=UPI00261C8D2D|nr:signal recognition particle-docking protein FtsY [uncultured Thermanaerothrix sp.]